MERFMQTSTGKAYFILFLGFGLMMVSLPAGAPEIQFYEITSEIIDNELTRNLVTITFSLPAPNNLEYPVVGDVTEFSWRSNFQSNCTLARQISGSVITCDVSRINKTARTLNFEYSTTGFVKEIERNKWLYGYNYQTSVPVAALSVIVKLPEGTGLVEKQLNRTVTGFLPFSPLDGEKRTDGRRIILEWNRNNLTAGDTLGITVFYENINPSQLNPLFLASIIILMFLVLLFVYLYLKKGKSMVILDESLESILPILREDEKKVIDCLLKENGETAQRKIVYDTNFSKAKVSRLIKDLRDRRIIKVEEKGRINKIYLLKKPKKPIGTITEEEKPKETGEEPEKSAG